MGNKANSRHIKRIASSKYMSISRKKSTYIAKPLPGRHNKLSNISLKTVLTEKLGLTSTGREAEIIIKSKDIKVNGKTITEPLYGVGFGDIIHIKDEKDGYIVLTNKHGTFSIEKNKGAKSVFRVVGKYIAKGKKVMIRLHDGSTLNVANSKNINVNDSVELKDGKIDSIVTLKEGGKCMVIKGTHASESGTINKIHPGTATRMTLVSIASGKGNFETTLENIMAIAD